jgi:hypothetical protein
MRIRADRTETRRDDPSPGDDDWTSAPARRTEGGKEVKMGRIDQHDAALDDVPRDSAPLLTTFPSGRPRFVSAVFPDLEKAVKATRSLEARGYLRDQVSVFMSTETRREYLDTHPELRDAESNAVVVDRVELEKERRTLEGAGAGGAIGGALGAVGAAVAAIGTTLAIPPLGIVVAGPLAAALAGAGAGAATGGLVGALVGTGMSEYRARRFEELLEEGEIIVGVMARTEAERTDIEEKLSSLGGTPIRESESA